MPFHTYDIDLNDIKTLITCIAGHFDRYLVRYLSVPCKSTRSGLALQVPRRSVRIGCVSPIDMRHVEASPVEEGGYGIDAYKL